MRIMVVVVGRVRPPLDEAVREYEARAARYWKLSVEEVDAGVGRGGAVDPDQVRRAEGERILARLPESGELWLLTRKGRGMASEALAEALGQRALHGLPPVAFCIGGAFGFSPEVREASRRRISLSPMTLPHEMARLILAEQIYRAGTILRGEPYHKGGGGS
jgi:23S rRNA (pseudouridine1915-N3)-methyltransferase